MAPGGEPSRAPEGAARPIGGAHPFTEVDLNERSASRQRLERPRTAFVLTASDQSAGGGRPDESGRLVGERLALLGFEVERAVVPDDAETISAALASASDRHPLVLTTGGTGLTPRDVTPQATARILDYEVPGIAEAMRAEGRRNTPMASLSRGLAGVRGRSLILNLPGSPRGAVESLEAVVPVLDHALETLAGPFDHRVETHAGRRDLPDPAPTPGRPADEDPSASAASGPGSDEGA